MVAAQKRKEKRKENIHSKYTKLLLFEFGTQRPFKEIGEDVNSRKHKMNSCTPCFRKKTPTHIIGYKLSSSYLILIIFDTNIPYKI